MISLRPKGVIFDCDGVLFESKAANLAYYNAIFSAFDIPPVTSEQRERAHICHTAASPVVFEQILGEDRRDEALKIAASLHYQQFIPCMIPEPGMREAISALAAMMPLAIATNRGTSMRDVLLHFDLADHFQVVVTSKDVERPKPYPDMLLYAAHQLGHSVDELLFIGDSELDAAAAQAAGMPFIGYRNLYHGLPMVESHAELYRIIAAHL